MGYQCLTCGRWHDERPTSFGLPLPAAVATLGDAERIARAELGSDQCILDNEHYFVLGNLDLRVRGTDEVPRWSAWSTLSRKNFERVARRRSIGGIRQDEADYLVHAAMFGVAG
jgi:hypothetical protein